MAAAFATGLHQVDNPVFDRDGNLYVTYSGTRGQEVPVSIFRVRPNGTRETFSSGIVNATSMAIDAAGTPVRLEPVRRHRVPRARRRHVRAVRQRSRRRLRARVRQGRDDDGTLFVGDRSGTIFRVDREGKAKAFASVPASVAAFHLAIGPDRAVYVTAPTLSTYDSVFRVDLDGVVTALDTRFGRPQGIAFDASGTALVVEALAGASGLYRLQRNGPPELVVAGPGLVGVAVDPTGGVVVCSNETVFRLR